MFRYFFLVGGQILTTLSEFFGGDILVNVLFFWVLEREFWNFLSLDMEPWYFFQVSRHEDVNRSVVNTGFFYRCSHVKCWITCKKCKPNL
ncbi:uncharacterized protein OCT59_011198 [Rhizophagus irregularis]|uniref:uncharacterized protein n=1 Tax=Rhizophagus irregularis TaxID=588596 RepID=UPI003323E85F|nr:hypothetical protein OCT59_011198 [Rhizophagus irregularis]